MRRRPSSLATAIAAIVSVVLVVAGCEARVYGTPPDDTDAPQLTVVAPPQGGMASLPEAPPDQPVKVEPTAGTASRITSVPGG